MSFSILFLWSHSTEPKAGIRGIIPKMKGGVKRFSQIQSGKFLSSENPYSVAVQQVDYVVICGLPMPIWSKLAPPEVVDQILGQLDADARSSGKLHRPVDDGQGEILQRLAQRRPVDFGWGRLHHR